jgi:hypothetical protein
MRTAAINELNGKVVLVCSAQDHRNPPTGLRGTIFVRNAENGGRPVVEVEIEFPQMFTSRAHVRRVALTDEAVAQMLASERYGAFTVTLPDRLDPEASPGNE